MENENWKIALVTSKSVWEVSDQGRVKRNGEIWDYSNCNGYVRLSFGLLHRKVAELFIPNPDNKPCVDHINTDIHDNRAVNLRWCTQKENNNNPLTLKNKSEVQKEVQNRPEVKAKKSATVKKIQKEVLNRPEVRVKRSASLKGKNKNKCHITNGVDRKFVKPELVDYYLERGYHLGRK